MSESQSAASSDSSSSMEPWFCDACKAGVTPVGITQMLTIVINCIVESAQTGPVCTRNFFKSSCVFIIVFFIVL